MIYAIMRSLLFRLDPERAHRWALRYLKFIYPAWRVKQCIAQLPKRPVSVLGLHFPNPIGLAAGLDKSGDYIDALWGLGFGFVEVGGVTPLPQPGNSKPRLFRLTSAHALINRFGFNNAGVDYLITRLKKRKIKGILGVNIGKNVSTPLTEAAQDYRACYEKVYPYVDYATINVSSPNTPALRQLQKANYLHDLLGSMKQLQNKLQMQYKRRVPLLLKISPDLTPEDLAVVVKVALEEGIEGIIAANTSVQRYGLEALPHANEAGGLSGAPLFTHTLETVRMLRSLVGEELPIIASGGIFSADQVVQLLASGATLVQLYTALIYKGPSLVKKILKFIT